MCFVPLATNQLTNQSVNQSINQSTSNQPINHSIITHSSNQILLVLLAQTTVLTKLRRNDLATTRHIH